MVGENASEMLVEVIDSYLEDAPKLLHVSTAIAQGDAALRQATHTLNSTSASVLQLSKFCRARSNRSRWNG